MEIRELRYFVTIVEQSTFTAAAAKLHISQPSLSATIKKLENKVGLSLLDRSARDIRLTKEGSILYYEARKLLNHFEHVLDEMERLKKDGPLDISIGLIESAKFWLPKVLCEFKKQYPNIHVKIFDLLSSHEVINSFNNYKIHLAITNQFIDNSEIKSIPIYEERLVALIPESHNLTNKEYLTIHELETEAFIVCREGFQTREDILNTFRKAGIKPNLQFEIERFETACSLVENGLGITVVPENYVKNAPRYHFQIKQIQKPNNISRTVYLTMNKNRYLPPIVLTFIKLIKEQFPNTDIYEQ
ncbi:LysR family transcriptional regulator [Halobacillus shinanisalinarum]|uniref:LysR family transcriptional regulator n=1 Tax=Halobacillus shinanisalinarum TaxID=2932258 RepID=A0ABY4H353_9BACI|nr:LysR family transcriptional regulator [Halobacillus shinanisalinarum]UOQ94853.1 LysR family transcriptional regulator [Halobacillus shinanisalinarum]